MTKNQIKGLFFFLKDRAGYAKNMKLINRPKQFSHYQLSAEHAGEISLRPDVN